MDEIYKKALEDPTLLSTIDIDSLLEKTEREHYLENKTPADIAKDVFDAIMELPIDITVAQEICTRLGGYRVVDRVCDLRNGRLMRWIKKNPPYTLTNGGLLVNVNIENGGVKLLCKNNANRFFNVIFDDSIIFQKLTMEEQIVILAT